MLQWRIWSAWVLGWVIVIAGAFIFRVAVGGYMAGVVAGVVLCFAGRAMMREVYRYEVELAQWEREHHE